MFGEMIDETNSKNLRRYKNITIFVSHWSIRTPFSSRIRKNIFRIIIEAYRPLPRHLEIVLRNVGLQWIPCNAFIDEK